MLIYYLLLYKLSFSSNLVTLLSYYYFKCIIFCKKRYFVYFIATFLSFCSFLNGFRRERNSDIYSTCRVSAVNFRGCTKVVLWKLELYKEWFHKKGAVQRWVIKNWWCGYWGCKGGCKNEKLSKWVRTLQAMLLAYCKLLMYFWW